MTDALLLWPLTYLVHGTFLLGAAWIASRWIQHPVLSETLWRCANARAARAIADHQAVAGAL